MRKSQFTPEQILQALRQAEGGTAVGDICRKLGVAEATVAPLLPMEDAVRGARRP